MTADIVVLYDSDWYVFPSSVFSFLPHNSHYGFVLSFTLFVYCHVIIIDISPFRRNLGNHGPQADLQAMDWGHRIGQPKQFYVFRFFTPPVLP